MIDWEKLRNEYIGTEVTYRELAARYDVSLSAVAAHSKKENWRDLRRAAGEEPQAPEEAPSGDRTQKAVDRLFDVVDEALRDTKQFYRCAQKNGEEAVGKKLDTKSVKEMVGILKELHALNEELRQSAEGAGVICVEFEGETEQWSR